ncbi:MAG: RNA 2'-phosphotransferase [Lewinellaceae bacterium]|nr:RNA 2'-phosphotransferase [Saprospiraceae bacterium]MCB9340617.1 RNA 2'-phosphotransferase [Lewinellaceae bacterium]
MKDIIRLSKFLSLVLRHRPEKIGLALDANGWAEVTDLLEKMNQNGYPIDPQLLAKVVETSDKQRFALSADGTMIRANQGHSVRVDLGLKPVVPPELLFHGTATKNLNSIHKLGLHKGKRHHVHLSADKATAAKVGGRHGKAVVLKIMAGKMHRSGHLFYRSENGIWLVEAVPVEFIERQEENG